MLIVGINVCYVPITDIRASAQFFWVACHHLSARLDGAEPVPPGGPVELVMLNAPAGELGKAGPLGCHRQGSHAVSLRASGELLQRRSERNTTEGSIHGNANNAPKMPMG